MCLTVDNRMFIAGLIVVIALGAYIGYTLTNPSCPSACEQKAAPAAATSEPAGEAPQEPEPPGLPENDSAESSSADSDESANEIAEPEEPVRGMTRAVLELFWGEGCPECAAEKEFLTEMGERYSDLEVIMYEVNEDEENQDLFMGRCDELGLGCGSIPVTMIGSIVFAKFRDFDGDFTYHKQEKAFVGYRNQIEISIMNELGILEYDSPVEWKGGIQLLASTDKEVYYEKDPMEITAVIRSARDVNGCYVAIRGVVGGTGPYVNGREWVHLKRGENIIVFKESAPRCFGCGGFVPGVYPIDVWLEKDEEEIERVTLSVEIRDL